LPLGIQPTDAEGILRPGPCCIQLGTKALYLQHMASRSALEHAGLLYTWCTKPYGCCWFRTKLCGPGNWI